MSERALFVASGIAGALAVVLGAFGAHALRDHFASLADGETRRRLWETASHYHLMHALAVGIAGYLSSKTAAASAASIAGFCFLAGILLFSGSLYAMAVTGIRGLGAVTPFGGLAFIAGWSAVAIAAWRL
jgi:uncharacterized membrane protein YgdD (TMEM256/DUF423 family)